MKIKLTESDLHQIIKESVKSILKEYIEDFYAEEDDNGNTGKPGEVKSYNIGWNDNVSKFEKEAEEEGLTLEEYLKQWWNETGYEGRSFTWQKLKGGYGYHGDTILKLGNVVFKDIFGQLMIDEYAPEV